MWRWPPPILLSGPIPKVVCVAYAYVFVYVHAYVYAYAYAYVYARAHFFACAWAQGPMTWRL